MGLFGKKKEITKADFSHMDGVKGFPEGTITTISIDNENECITMTPKIYKSITPRHLKYDQIIDSKIITEKEIKETSKSTVGRALVGGVLLGPLGAIVGGMSGIGTNKTNETSYYMVINYRSQDGEIKVLSFKTLGLGCFGLNTNLSKIINKDEIKETVERYL